jgi:uncharacterized protein YodC (DUF2158 family)
MVRKGVQESATAGGFDAGFGGACAWFDGAGTKKTAQWLAGLSSEKFPVEPF